MEDMRKDDRCMQVAAMRRADCFDNDGRRRVHCENCGRCCKLDEEVALEKAATTEKMEDAATEPALHGVYLNLTHSLCRIPQHIKWKHSARLHPAGYIRYSLGVRASVSRALRPKSSLGTPNTVVSS